MNPDNCETTYLFPWGTDSNGQAYIQIDPDMVCPVYVNENFDSVVKSVGQLLNVPAEEGQQLRAYLETGQVVLANLIPSTLEQFEPIFTSTIP